MADLGALRGRVLAANLAVHGVAATVTRPHPDGAPIATRVIWPTPLHDESMPVGRDFPRRDARRVLAVPRAACPTLPRNTFIDAPEATAAAAPVRRWQVDSIEQATADHYQAAVVPVP